MLGRLGWMEILVIVVLVVILFGHNKIPGMMRNLADGLNIFKKELKIALIGFGIVYIVGNIITATNTVLSNKDIYARMIKADQHSSETIEDLEKRYIKKLNYMSRM